MLAAKTVVAKQLSVRQTEELVKRLLSKKGNSVARSQVADDSDQAVLAETLSEYFGAVVKICANKRGKGKLVIQFSDLEQFDGILKRLNIKEQIHR